MTVATGLLMAVTIAGALVAVNVRNILHAIFGLALALLGIAGLFLILGSPFVAAMEVLIYVGGISVAMVFAVMLSSVTHVEPEGGTRRLLAALAAGTLVAGVVVAVHHAGFPVDAVGVTDPEAWSVQKIGVELLDRYNVVFETLSVILLLAIIGAITIANRDRAAAKAVTTNATKADTPARDDITEEAEPA